ncbi:MAG: SDR family oxidoreductase [Dehalococcoidia bacterium]
MSLHELFSLRGRTALVTGGSRGIGQMIAQGFASFGARVLLVARDRDAVDAAVRQLRDTGAEAQGFTADLSRIDELDRLVGELHAASPRLDILVNNAAAVWNASLETFPPDGWDKVVNLNLRSPFFLIQRLLPLLRAAASDQSPARIINVVSADALHVPLTDTYSYTAAKAGLVMLTRMLAQRLGPDRITVNALAPGPFETRMTARAFAERGAEFLAQIPLHRYGTTEDAAGAAIFLASRAGAYVNGTTLPVDGGWVGAL